MTYLDGMDWAAAQHADQELKNRWSEVIARFVFGSYRHANLFHADPHPGNYRFGADGTVGFVDFGCVKHLTEPQRQRIVKVVRAAVDGRKDDLRDIMIDSGFFTADSALTADDTYRWWQGILYETLDSQPATYTEHASARAIQFLLDVRAPRSPMRQMSIPPDLVFFSRINLSMNAVFSALRACIYNRGLLDDMDGVAPPVTELGRQHLAWVRQRGLPLGWTTMTSADVASIRLPWDAADPYPFYEARRAEGEVVWDDTAQAWLALSYDAAREVLGGSGWTSDPLANPLRAGRDRSAQRDFFAGSMLFADGAGHARLRTAARDVFTRSFVANLRAGVEAITAALIDEPEAGVAFDFMADIALPLPIAVIGGWLNLEPATARLLRELSPVIIRMLGALADPDEIAAGAAPGRR